MNLDDLRRRLDTIDEQLLSLLAERAQVILQVAAYKRQHDIPVYVPEREAFIIQRLRALAPRPLSADAVERIYRMIIEEMRNLEAENIVH